MMRGSRAAILALCALLLVQGEFSCLALDAVRTSCRSGPLAAP